MENKLCKVCGSQLEYHEAGFRKDGSEYKSFWGCPNYKDAKHRAEKEKYLTKKEPTNGSAMLVDEVLAGLKKIDQRIQDMAEWFGENSPKWEK